jgi:MFS family permease
VKGSRLVATRWTDLLTDVRPLQHSADFRRLWVGSTVSQLGQQMTAVAIAYQVYVLTGSTFAVGLVGLYGLVPMIVFGLYGGAIVDAIDRRTVALVASCGLWAMSLALVAQAVLEVGSVGLLYAIIAVQSGCYAVNSPARQAILPRLLPLHLLPAANALTSAAYNLGFTVGPLIAGVLIAWQGVTWAYVVDAVAFTASLYALVRLPPVPPAGGTGRVPGLSAVVDGLQFLRAAPNLRMTFVVDLCAMVLAQPRALFPALALTVFAGGASSLGLLQASPAVGALLAFAVSGWMGRVHRHGFAIVAAVTAYGIAVASAGVAAVGAPGVIWLTVVMLAASGSADMISSNYRATVLQAAAPDEMRGRLQGVFTVVVAGGPRLGDFLIGSLAAVVGDSWAMVYGGLGCVAALTLAVAAQRSFLSYDARAPRP